MSKENKWVKTKRYGCENPSYYENAFYDGYIQRYKKGSWFFDIRIVGKNINLYGSKSLKEAKRIVKEIAKLLKSKRK